MLVSGTLLELLHQRNALHIMRVAWVDSELHQVDGTLNVFGTAGGVSLCDDFLFESNVLGLHPLIPFANNRPIVVHVPTRKGAPEVY